MLRCLLRHLECFGFLTSVAGDPFNFSESDTPILTTRLKSHNVRRGWFESVRGAWQSQSIALTSPNVPLAMHVQCVEIDSDIFTMMGVIDYHGSHVQYVLVADFLYFVLPRSSQPPPRPVPDQYNTLAPHGQFGYRTTPEIMEFLKESLDLKTNLSAAAHLIHGSSEGRFTITYCPGPGLSREDVVGGEVLRRHNSSSCF